MLSRKDKILYKAKISAQDIDGKLVKDELWIIWFEDALKELNLEFKFKFKELEITIDGWGGGFFFFFFVFFFFFFFFGDFAIKTTYDEIKALLQLPFTVALYYAIEGNKIYTNFNGTARLVYYSSDLSLNDVPEYFDNVIVDYLVWCFYKSYYPEVEEIYRNLLERSKFYLRGNLLNLETTQK